MYKTFRVCQKLKHLPQKIQKIMRCVEILAARYIYHPKIFSKYVFHAYRNYWLQEKKPTEKTPLN